MQFPNKLYSYKNSALALIPTVLNEKKALLTKEKLNLEDAIHAKERKQRLVGMSLEYGLYPTEADMESLAEFFPNVNLRKLYEVEKYHQKLAKILDEQFAKEKAAIDEEIAGLKSSWMLLMSR